MKDQNYWEKMASQVQAPKETYNKRSDVSQADANFILRYADQDSLVLDFGAGAGTVTNKIYESVKAVLAVETYPGFTKFIDDDESILVVNANLENFRVRMEFDLAVATAVMQYFPEDSAKQMYSNIYDMLKAGGKLIARNHVGLHETVRVEKSEELQADYFAEYRYIDLEKHILEECGFSVEIIDEVPADHNAWENSKHLYFVCTK